MEYKKKVLLIGGSGIISSSICNKAVDEGMQVSIVNRGRRKKFINENANLIKADIRNESIDDLREKINVAQYDVVMDFITYNTQQLKKILSVIKGNCKQYIFVSSATAYKECDEHHIYRDDDPIGNESWKYSVDKSECEWFLARHKEELGFEYTIVRPYVTYGVTRIPYQIAPLDYYTIINRIKMKKPIPITGLNTKCTVTNSDEFAIGAVGLFLNNAAYGEAVHITSSYNTTWKNIIDIIAMKYDINVDFIDIPMNYLAGQKHLGFDFEELQGDKSRNMVFDNTKIKTLVPEFKGEVKIDDYIDKTLKFYEDNKDEQKVDYLWDGRIDTLINKYCKSCNIKQGKAVYKQYQYRLDLKNKLKYLVGRSELLYVLCKKAYSIKKGIKR